MSVAPTPLRPRLEAAEVSQPPRLARATPYRWRDPRAIPRRDWVYGRQLLRGTVSVVIAPGATGKTALLVGTAMALTTGRDLLDKRVWGRPQRVWLWNLEDSGEELSRLIQAAALHWRIAEQDIADRLYVDSALDGAELKLAVEDREGFRIARPLVEALVEELLEQRIDVLIVDPFVSSHGVRSLRGAQRALVALTPRSAAEEMRSLRGEVGMTQAGLADWCGLEVGYIRDVEQGRAGHGYRSRLLVAMLRAAPHLVPAVVAGLKRGDGGFRRVAGLEAVALKEGEPVNGE